MRSGLRTLLRPIFTGLLLASAAGASPAEVMGRQDAPPPASARVLVSGDATAVLILHYRDPDMVPGSLRSQAVEEGGEEALVRVDDGGVELHFTKRPMDDVVPILRTARVELDGLPVVIRILEELRSGDLWEFQARLSQAGLREIRIISDPPQPAETMARVDARSDPSPLP
jgi:hypothetical protein